MGFYKYVREAWKQPRANLGDSYRERLIEWRKLPTITRCEKPTRLDRARSLGYKAKKGFVIVRVKVRKGSHVRSRPSKGRKPAKMTIQLPLRKSLQVVGEGRVQRKFPNLEVINSYFVGDDGVHKFFEVILVDPFSPSIENDKDLKWVLQKQHTKRVARGLTSAGKKSRGLKWKGKGSEKTRKQVRM